jgi:hypothetical protein
MPMAARFRPLPRTFGERRLPVTIRPTKADVAIAHTVARKTSGPPEKLARALTWGADEKVLLALTAIGWLSLREAPANLYGGPPATPSFWRPRLLCGPTA